MVPDHHQGGVDLDGDFAWDGPDGPDMDGNGVGDAADQFVDGDGDLMSDHAFVEHLSNIDLYNPFRG